MRRNYLIFCLLGFSWYCTCQTKKGCSIYVEASNWSNIITWPNDTIDWWESEGELINRARTIKFGFKRIHAIGAPNQKQTVSYGITALCQSSSYSQSWYVQLIPEWYYQFLSRTDQIFVGVDFGYTKEFVFSKQKRNRFRPFVAVQLSPFYGIYQKHIYSSPSTGEKVHTEPIEANNYFMLVGQLNIGANIYLDKKKRKALGIYLPLAFTKTFDVQFTSFPSVGFVGLKYTWLQ